MFSHVMIGTDDIDVSRKFYDAMFAAIGVPEGKIDPKRRIWYRTDTGAFGVSIPIDGEPATGANGGTIGFTCASPEMTDAWHAAGVANGGTSIEDPPGWRESAAGDQIYLAYLLDPYGNKLCGLHRP
ncbi:MAG: glyoxalase [Alphaproteobacteria bacterium]|nr:glyoxalase [Alphaproteobacteria bacterium]